jgi:hypothetical protein
VSSKAFANVVDFENPISSRIPARLEDTKRRPLYLFQPSAKELSHYHFHLREQRCDG